jgi:hypothetical protein
VAGRGWAGDAVFALAGESGGEPVGAAAAGVGGVAALWGLADVLAGG